ncbi:MAG TPA: hypothetical protein PKA63_09180 [Oligoflexia bacterium]|nr:hypothetical protein [Oligoflexia bacterium]HMP48825.1 hypothetical protein [Oligoflexia bacterium]
MNNIKRFSASFTSLLGKELLIKRKTGESLLAHSLHGFLFTLLLTFLVRNISIKTEEMHIVVIPALWIILLSTTIRYNIQSFSAEIHGGIFRMLTSYGYSASSIFWSKVTNSFFVVLLMLIIEFLTFGILIGITDISWPLFMTFLIFVLSLPAVLITAAVAAVISLYTEKAEVLMPILLVPLLLMLSLSVMSLVENFFIGNTFNPNSYWFHLLLGETLILVLLAPPLFNNLINIK